MIAEDGTAGYIAGWGPPPVSAAAAGFARQAVTRCGDLERERAKNLLWAAARLADHGIGLGLAEAPEVLLHPSVIERFAAYSPGLSPSARRTLRTNLRFIARHVVPHLRAPDAPLGRERAKPPCTPAEIDGFLTLARAQPTPGRRMRATALICLGAGAGLTGADLRAVRGADVARRPGGVVAVVRGTWPRAVPVLARYHGLLLEAAEYAGDSTECSGPEAAWGHRNSNLPGPKGEMFFGYYLSAVVMTREEDGPAVPEMACRMTVCSCHLDPVRALAGVLLTTAASGIPPGDVIDDSGYAHRDTQAWAIPLRNAGAQLVQDLHPHDRGPRGTHHGAVIANGNLHCPQTPRTLLELGPLPPGAAPDAVAAHDQQTAELARYKPGRHTAGDADGYHRVTCPAAAGKIRCPLRPDSMLPGRDRPEILAPPEHPPACCTQQTVTVPPQVNAKTRQKHDYPSREWPRSYRRRTSAERGFSTIKDPATTSIARGWCRLTGLTAITLWLACLLVARNQRVLASFDARQADDARRAAAGLPPRTRKRRRASLAAPATAPP